MTKGIEKLFIIRKYVMAKSAKEALKKESKHKADEIFLDEAYRNNHPQTLESVMNFNIK